MIGLLSACVLLIAVAIPSWATLTGSSFESGDGNLASNGLFDWNHPIETIDCGTAAQIPHAGTNCGTDLTKSTSDNAFGQGAKEDISNPTEVTGSIPPNKSDLTRFYVNKEKAGDDYLYLAWERSNVLGNANMDFEFNQNSTLASGKSTPLRTAGDLLITFDFVNGGSNPELGLLKWQTSGSKNDCFSANALPCWGITDAQGDQDDGVNDQRLNLTAAGFAEGAINTGTVHDDNRPPLGGADLPGFTFGEAGINLTDADVFPQNQCVHFGSAFLKSRSSASFTAELKDFIAPIPVDISNCGSLKIIKRTDPRGVDQNFNFTSDINSSAKCTKDTTPDAFALNDKGNTTSDSADNTEACTDVIAGTYHVTEGTNPANFTLKSISCTSSVSGPISGAGDLANQKATVTIAVGETVTCVFVNERHLGAIKISKTSVKGNTALAGATFSIKQNGTPIAGSPFTTDANGEICVGNLPFADYVVKETQAPSGYKIDDGAEHTVTVDNNASCSDATYVGEAISFTDTPLSEIEVQFRSLAGAGVTNAQIECAKGANTVAAKSENGSADAASPNQKFDDTDEVFTNLDPGVYTCTIDVDP
jgi:hypothetical protein